MRASSRARLANWTLHRSCALTLSGNTASVRLLEKCGFRSAGTVWYGEDEYIMLVLRDQ
jgi:RimJ/RimL family protein N-acetyltransferase